jgi:hypothetical protein
MRHLRPAGDAVSESKTIPHRPSPQTRRSTAASGWLREREVKLVTRP